MKLFVFFLFLILPWLPWVGDWALRWTEGNEALEIAFVMFIFPLAMNAVQYWIIDNFIMDKSRDQGDSSGYARVQGDDDSSKSDEVTVAVEGEERAGLLAKSVDEEAGEGSRKTSPTPPVARKERED